MFVDTRTRCAPSIDCLPRSCRWHSASSESTIHIVTTYLVPLDTMSVPWSFLFAATGEQLPWNVLNCGPSSTFPQRHWTSRSFSAKGPARDPCRSLFATSTNPFAQYACGILSDPTPGALNHSSLLTLESWSCQSWEISPPWQLWSVDDLDWGPKRSQTSGLLIGSTCTLRVTP